jgi:hypothetical protein
MGFCSMLSEVYDEILQREANDASVLDHTARFLRCGAKRVAATEDRGIGMLAFARSARMNRSLPAFRRCSASSAVGAESEIGFMLRESALRSFQVLHAAVPPSAFKDGDIAAAAHDLKNVTQ